MADTLHTHPLGETVTHRLRYQANLQPHSTLKCKTTVDYTAVSPAGATQASWGVAAGQEIVWSQKKIPLTVSLQSTWFRTDDYNSRIYTYERNVLYAFSVPSFYGKGVRTVVNVNYTLKNRLTVWLRFANTSYLDNREEIGTGLEKITGKTKSDISLQIRLVIN
jgi:hypothetical protein